MVHIKNLELITDNAQIIHITLFTPKHKAKASVVIAPALGVDRIYYNDFALWLAKRGFIVVTFDYSSMGTSNTEHYKISKNTITDWAMFDCKRVLEQVSLSSKNLNIYWIGHSLGGQITAMVPNIDMVSKVITIASGSGYWRHNAPALKNKVWFLWYFLAPTCLFFLGYFPGKRLGMVGNLPYGVMKQWRKWCLHPLYLYGVEDNKVKKAYKEFDKPITSISFSDDQLMSLKNIESLHGFFEGSQLKMQRINPEQVKVKNIGHFGLFKKELENTLWRTYILPELILNQ